jgi:hypothetical protein
VEYGTFSHTVEIINFQQIDEIPSGQNLFFVYPNPGNGNINLVFKQDQKEAVICVRNIFGQQVRGPFKYNGLVENEEIFIEMGHLPQGIYFVEVLTEDQGPASVKYLLNP